MNLFEVYPLFDVEPIKAQGPYVWDQSGQKYLDLYGGHAVISIGHSHPHFVEKIQKQVDELVFYSNSVKNPLQIALAQKLGEISGYTDYQLFLCNSGAEANENALKLASFHTQKKKVIAFEKGFHGRTSAAVAAGDNPKIVSPLNANHEVVRLPLHEPELLEQELKKQDACAVIMEGIQGVGGIHIPQANFLKQVEQLCKKYGVVLILDEVQSGYGRSGHFFAHQIAGIKPDLISIAKGMGNGFPIGGVLIHPNFKPWFGMLGTTFGGNHLACAAGLAVLEVLESEKLLNHAQELGEYWQNQFKEIPEITEIRGAGLMIGLELASEMKPIRQKLLYEHHIFTGASGSHTLRLLPPLNITKEHADAFTQALTSVLNGKI